jgi:hypothetical protein
MATTRFLSLAALLLAPISALAQSPPPKPVLDPAARCAVHTLPNIARSTPHLKWSGACRDGLAEGKGIASFAATPTSQASKSFEGYFRNGFFVGETPLKHAVEPLVDRAALIELPSNAAQEGRIWLEAPMDSETGVLARCGRGVAQIAVEAPHDLASNDEPRLRRMMQRAALAYRAACPSPLGLRLFVVPADKRRNLAEGSFGAVGVVARANLAEGAAADALHKFENVATNESDQGRRTQAIEARRKQERADSRRNWQDFTRANAVAVWVTPKQLDLNPFHYQGKIVALPGAFVRMIAPNTALLRDARYGTVMVSGIPNDLLQDKSTVVIAGRASGRKTLPNSRQEVASIEATAWKLCQRTGCADYIDWIDEEKKFAWGEDQSEFLR